VEYFVCFHGQQTIYNLYRDKQDYLYAIVIAAVSIRVLCFGLVMTSSSSNLNFSAPPEVIEVHGILTDFDGQQP
jgi:hypothetical protein